MKLVKGVCKCMCNQLLIVVNHLMALIMACFTFVSIHQLDAERHLTIAQVYLHTWITDKIFNECVTDL